MTEKPTAGQFTPPTTDPWKGFRGVMAGTLILEVIVVALAFPVVAKLTDTGVTWASGLYLGVVVLALILLSGRQKAPRALEINLVMQVFVIGGGFFHWSIAVVGAVFACVWLYIAYIKRDVAKRIEEGRLFGQRPV
ncbi:DUF4233 domain-containing protein [Gordonia hydrophobica]|uniref:DUF4233 domain-containing protein n=1 Tax=Gordonia hydrophobica TaxID=40516 RepID=A0ABZ2U3A2_9ACTN|nr:DUF4233 domain-containing protein [Gordonia hydrophobica]MBM7368416.1 membrane protein implicated in regulation of membrane protease activity [Gordonia hydrophobica]